MNTLIKTLLGILIPAVLSSLRSLISPERYVEMGDKLLDFCERQIVKEPDFYDEWLLEIIRIIRTATGITDLPDVE